MDRLSLMPSTGDTLIKVIRHPDNAVFVSTGAITFNVRRADLR